MRKKQLQTAFTPNVTSFLNSQPPYNSGSTIPLAYVNWVLFDEQFNLVSSSSGFERVSAAGVIEPHTKQDMPITQSGYLYIYVSNTTPNIPVYFDNLKVKHIRGALLETNEYYPYGLKMASISYKASMTMTNSFGWNGGNEYEDEGELNYSNTFYRKYDAQIGRFTGVDMMAENFSGINPYQFGFNNPVMFNDPMGDKTRALSQNERHPIHMSNWENSGIQRSYSSYYDDGGGQRGEGFAALFAMWFSDGYAQAGTYTFDKKGEFYYYGSEQVVVFGQVKNSQWSTSSVEYRGFGDGGDKRYSFNQYVSKWERDHGVRMTDLQRETLATGCVGVTALELGDNRDRKTGMPLTNRAYSSFSIAQQKAKELESVSGNARVLIYSIRFWTDNKNGFSPSKDGSVNMSSWNPAIGRYPDGDIKYTLFDYGLYSSQSNSWFHANQAQPGMIIYQSSLAHYSRPLLDFNRQVFCIATTNILLK